MAERAKATREAAAKTDAAARRAGGVAGATEEPTGAGTAVTKTAARTAGGTAVRAAPKAATKVAPSTAKPTGTVKPTETVKPTGTRAATGRGTAKPTPKHTRSTEESDRIRAALSNRRRELHIEYDQTMAEITELQRDRLTDSAGDDQADTGTKTFEREQEISLANSILEKINQVERALERLDGGSYGWCERCADTIPVERLAAFPSATLCVSCKQLEERR